MQENLIQRQVRMHNWVKITDKLPSPELVQETPVIVVKDQKLTNEDLVSFASTLGNVWSDNAFSGLQQTVYRGKELENSSVALVAHDNNLGTRYVPWHVDVSHYPTQTIPNRLLYAFEDEYTTPTVFFNSSEALERNPDIVDELKYVSAYHLAPYETPWKWPVKRPCIDKHPYHGYLSFICPGCFAKKIEGITTTNEESWKWTEKLVKDMWDEDLEYIHNYEKGDVVIYDNLTVIHRRDEFKGERRLKRVTWEPFIY